MATLPSQATLGQDLTSIFTMLLKRSCFCPPGSPKSITARNRDQNYKLCSHDHGHLESELQLGAVARLLTGDGDLTAQLQGHGAVQDPCD